MHEYGDCSFCGGEVKEELIELDYRYKKQLYIFRDVPTGVCQQCGEKYLVASTAKVIAHAIRTKKDWPETVTPHSRSQVEPYDFCTYVQKVTQKEVLFLDLELDGRQECSYEDRNVAALMLTMPCSVSGDNPFLTFFPTIPLQFVSPLNVG